MAGTQRNTDLILDNLALSLRRIDKDMQGFVKLLGRQPMEAYLGNLQATVDGIGSAFPSRPVCHPTYLVQWADFASKKRKDLDKATARYLCWEPDVATSTQFLTYLAASKMRLTRRPLAGLVRSCHHRWKDTFPASPSVRLVRGLVSRYDGPSPVILKWKSNPDSVLSAQGQELLGQSLVEENKTLVSLLGEWYLDSRSPFVHKVVEAAIAACRNRLAKPTRGLLELLFGELLIWSGWEPQQLRQEIAQLILHGAVAGQTREILQRFIMINSHLGDPRLEANGSKWAEVPQEARDRLLVWLTENPFRLLEQVYQEGRGWTMRPQDRDRETKHGASSP